MTVEGIKPLFEDPTAARDLRDFALMARADGPSQADLDRLAARLGPALALSGAALAVSTMPALGTPPANVGAVQAAAAKLGLFGKLMSSTGGKLLAVGLSLGVGVAMLGYLRPAAPQPHVAQPAHVEAPAPVVARASTPVVEQVAPEAEAPVVQAPQVKRAAVRRRAEPAVVAVEPAAPAPSELSLMKQAEALRAQPQQALAVLARHEQLYPRGVLAQEREMLSIELLVKANKLATANQRAQQFRSQFPGSAHLPRLESLLSRAAAQ